eukprot:jgi/Tetstr1/425983/TSEL_016332.t1
MPPAGVRQEDQEELLHVLQSWLATCNANIAEDIREQQGQQALEVMRLQAEVEELRGSADALRAAEDQNAALAARCARLEREVASAHADRDAYRAEADGLRSVERQLEGRVVALEAERAAAPSSSVREHRLERRVKDLRAKYEEKRQSLTKYQNYLRGTHGLAALHALAAAEGKREASGASGGDGGSEGRGTPSGGRAETASKAVWCFAPVKEVGVEPGDGPLEAPQPHDATPQVVDASPSTKVAGGDGMGILCTPWSSAISRQRELGVSPPPASTRKAGPSSPCKDSGKAAEVAMPHGGLKGVAAAGTPGVERGAGGAAAAAAEGAAAEAAGVAGAAGAVGEAGAVGAAQAAALDTPTPAPRRSASPDGDISMWDSAFPGMPTQSSVTSAKRPKPAARATQPMSTCAAGAAGISTAKGMRPPAARQNPVAGVTGAVKRRAAASPRWRTKTRRKQSGAAQMSLDDSWDLALCAKSQGGPASPRDAGEGGEITSHLSSGGGGERRQGRNAPAQAVGVEQPEPPGTSGDPAGHDPAGADLGGSCRERKQPLRGQHTATATVATGYKFQEVVRGKDKRARLPGHACEDCTKFYNALASWGHCPEQPECGHRVNRNPFAAHGALQQELSRHRHTHKPPETPEGFWDMGFMDSLDSRAEAS